MNNPNSKGFMAEKTAIRCILYTFLDGLTVLNSKTVDLWACSECHKASVRI